MYYNSCMSQGEVEGEVEGGGEGEDDPSHSDPSGTHADSTW